MVTNNFNLAVVSGTCFAGFTSKTGFIASILITFILFLPSGSQADGLFDFQMILAKKGNAEAQYKVGEMYETGFGVKKDMIEAVNWVTKSASQGHETANFKLLYWDVGKKGITKANKTELETLKVKAREGNPQAQFYIGKMHARGIGLKKNSDKAISWLNKAALVGVLAAEDELIIVREDKQRQVLAREKSRSRADEKKKRAELKARQAQEKQRRLHKKAKVNKKARTDEIRKKNKAVTDASLAAEKKAADEAALQTKIVAQKEAADRKREAEKQALLKKPAAAKEKRVTQFETDPCSGKSARFLSTCR